jgi:ketosteroid isomerase-like protein
MIRCICICFYWILMACGSDSMQKMDGAESLTETRVFIEKANQTYGDRFTSDDPNFYFSKYTSDAVIYPPQLPMISGRDHIRQYYFDGGKNKELTITIKTLNISIEGKIAVEEGYYDFPDGKGGSLDRGKFIALWKKDGGQWKLWREIWNTDLKPASN